MKNKKPKKTAAEEGERKSGSPKKRKPDAVEVRSDSPPPPARKRPKSSSELTIVDRLRGHDPVDALKEMVAGASDHSDGGGEGPIREFLSHGGQADDVLRLLESEEKTKSPEVALVFQAVETVLLHVAAEEAAGIGGGAVLAQGLIRKVLHGHFRYVMLLLSQSNTAYQAKSCLKMLSAMVAASGTAGAREILNKVDFDHKNFSSVVKRRSNNTNSKDGGTTGSDDVRTCYIHFLLAFLVSGNASLIKDLLEKKNSVSQIFPGLVHDPCETVTLVLTTLREKIVESSSVSKTSKMKLFGVFNLRPLLQLFHWRGTRNVDLASDEQQAEFKGDLERVSGSVSALFNSLLTSTKLGIVFHDPTCGNSGKNQNHLLQNLLKSFERPWEEPMVADLIAGALRTCPDQLRPYLTCLEKVWSPRSTDSWVQIADFLFVLFKRQDVSSTVTELDSKQPKLISSVIANVGCPDRVAKEVILPALENEHDIVRRKGVEMLSLIVSNVLRALEGTSQSVRKSVFGRLADRLPSAKVISQFWDREVGALQSEDRGNSVRYLACASRVLDVALTNYPQRYAALATLVQKMLDQVMELTDGEAAATNEARDMKLVLLHHLGKSSLGSLKQRETLELLLSVYATSDGDKGRTLAVGTLIEAVTRENILAESEMAAVELEAWLHHMPRVAASAPGDEIRSFLARQLSQQLTDTGKDEVMRRFLQRSNMGLNPVSIGLLEAYKAMGNKGSLASYVDAVCQSLVAIHEDPLDLAKELSDGHVFQSASKLIKSASLPLTGTIVGGEFADMLDAFRLLLAVRMGKGEDAVVAALGMLEQFIAGLASKKRASTALLRQPFVRSLFRPFSDKEGTKFVLSMIVLSGKTEMSNEIELGFRAKLDSDIFGGGDGGGGGHCSEEIIRQCLETLSPSPVVLCDLLVKALESSALKFTYMKATCLAAVLTTVVSRRLVMSREAESAIRRALPPVLLAHATRSPALRRRLSPPVAAFLKLNSHLSDCVTLDTFVKLCRATECGGGEDSQLIEVLAEQSEEFSASFQELVLKSIKAESLLGVQGPLICSLRLSRPQEEMLKFLKMSLRAYLSTGGGVTAGVIQLLNIICLEHGQDLSDIPDIPDNRANLEDVEVLRALFIVSKSGKELRPSVMCDRVLAPCLRMAIKCLKVPEQEGASISSLITAVTEVLLAEESCCLRSFIEDELWISYVKGVLKTCLKPTLDDPVRSEYIIGLSGLARLRYRNETEEDREESSLIYNMIYGHSNFIATMLDGARAHCKAKAAILRLILVLMRVEPSICAASHIPVFLGAYHGTLSLADQAILGIVFHHERCGVGLAEFNPIIWGQSALGHYSARQKSGAGAALWKAPKTSEVLALIESERMIRSAVDFPLKLELRPDLDGAGGPVDDDRTRYDPRFFLPLLCQICSPGVFIDRHLHLVECGALALVFASLGSSDKSMRAVGYVALARVYQQLELARLSAEKKVWLHLADMVRNGVRASKSAQIQTLRIPPLVTNFLSRICHVLRSPLDPMYKSISSFVLAKPALELFKVPEFLRLFHSRELGHEEERRWILTVIRDGMRDEIDYSVAQKDYFVKMLLSFHDCAAMSDEGSRSLVRQILARAARARKSAYDLVRHQGLLAWTSSSVLTHSSDAKAVAELARIVTAAWDSICGGDGNGGDDGDKVPSTVLAEFSLTLDVLADACQSAGEKVALKCIVRALKMVRARKADLVTPRDVVIYSRCLTEQHLTSSH